MEIQIWQVVILSLYAGFAMLDGLSFNVGLNGIIQTGVVTGLIMGRPELGLLVGGTFQSFALGIGTYGGASIPNWTSSAMAVTALASTWTEAEPLIAAVGVPLAALGVQFDVLGRMANTIFQQKADTYVIAGDLEGIKRMNLMGTIPWFLSRFIPMFVVLAFGETVTREIMGWINSNIPWMLVGFQLAGKILPGVGFTILLKYLPMKRHFSWLIVGFVLNAYLGMPVLGISLIGLAAALIVYRSNVEGPRVATGSADMGGDGEYDE